MSKLGDMLNMAYTIKTLGAFQSIKYYCLKNKTGRFVRLKPKGYKYPIILRTSSSDFPTFLQVNARRGYEISEIDPSVIIDCGANIGLSTVFFKNKYPKSKVISIEPEASNFDLLIKNTAVYPDVNCLKRGVWNKKCYLKIKDENVDKWAFQVEESNSKTDIEAISIMDIVRENNIEFIDILKIDIEGSEKYLLDESAHEWLSKVKILIIELHDRFVPGCSKALFTTLSKYDFSLDFKEDNMILKFHQ